MKVHFLFLGNHYKGRICNHTVQQCSTLPAYWTICTYKRSQNQTL